MDLDKILEMLNVEKLDESKQTEVKEKLQTIVETKVDEKVKEKEESLKEELTEKYEQKFEDYKNDITEKFSNFLDEVIEEEMEIPDKIKEYARKGELYSDVMETLKVRMGIDEGVLDDETRGLIKECKNEISDLTEKVNSLTSENMEVKKDAKELSASLYLREKCEGLPFKQKEKILSLLEGVTDKKEIDKKFDVLAETVQEDGEEVNEETNGKGQEETEQSKIDESTQNEDPFTKMKTQWLNIMSESK